MTERSYTYYNLGVAIAGFLTRGGEILCRTRDLETMEWGPYAPFAPQRESFSYPDRIAACEFLSAAARGERPFDPADYAEVDSPYTAGSGARLWVRRLGVHPVDYVLCEGRAVAAIGVLQKRIDVLVEDGFEGVTPLRDHRDPLLSQPVWGKRCLGTFDVPMRDGVTLSTAVYLPRNGPAPQTRFPVVLIRTCYGKPREIIMHPFIHYGYALVIQDTRGREESGGEWSPIVNEMDDGKDTLDWIAAQDWCDGSIGMIGASYLAIVQWNAAASGHPNLKAMISQVTGGTPTYEFPHRNGILCSGTLAWLFSMSGRRMEQAQMDRDDWADVVKLLPIREIPQRALGKEIPCWQEWMDHESMDDYWERSNWERFADRINVPTLYVSGWFDDVGTGTSQAWRMNRRMGRPDQRMILGAWRHQFNVSRDIHGIDYGVRAVRYDLFCQYIRWFDRFLKGVENGARQDPRVEYYVIGSNRWAQSCDWPPKESALVPYYLSGGGSANTRLGDGVLRDAPPAAEEPADHYLFDPNDPAPHLIDMSENECMVPENYREMELRPDVLVYTSAPLEKDLTVAGELSFVLYAATDRPDTDWVARLTEVDGEGNSLRLSDGVLRARYRESLKEPKLLTPGEVVRYEIPMSWVANTFRAGHRIRVEVTSGAENSIFPNHNTGKPIADDTEMLVASQTVFHDAARCSHILLPVIPGEN